MVGSKTSLITYLCSYVKTPLREAGYCDVSWRLHNFYARILLHVASCCICVYLVSRFLSLFERAKQFNISYESTFFWIVVLDIRLNNKHSIKCFTLNKVGIKLKVLNP